MKAKKWLKANYRRILSALLAFTLSINVGMIEIAASILPQLIYYEQPYSGSGDGSQNTPYILKDAADLAALAYNVAHIPNYSENKWFTVQPPEIDGVKSISVQSLSEKLSIGGNPEAPNDERYWFKGNIDFKNTIIYSEYPIFGTITDGAFISQAKLHITGDGKLSNGTAGVWGGIVSHVLDTPSSEGDIQIQHVEVSVELSDNNYYNVALGGIVGEVGAGADLSIVTATVSGGSSETGMNIDARRTYIGGAVGKINSGAKVTLSGVTIVGMMSNDADNGVVGGLVGAAVKGAEIIFDGTTIIPAASLMSADYKGMLIGLGDHALAYTGGSFALKIDNAEAKLDENKGADNVINGAVYRLSDFNAIAGDGSATAPYRIENANDFLLFAAAVNTGHERVVGAFPMPEGFEGNNAAKHEYIKAAHYTVVDNIDLGNAYDGGFNGIGYYLSAKDPIDYQAFTGDFNGDNSKITLDIDVMSDYTGLFGLVSGTAKIYDLTLAGSISSSGAYTGGIAAQVGVPTLAATGIKVEISGITNQLDIVSTKAGNAYVGGLVGNADFSAVSGNTSYFWLKNNTFSGSIESGGSYVGGLVGALLSQQQGNKANALDLKVDGYTFAQGAVIEAGSSSAGQLGGAFGAILANGSYKGSTASSSVPTGSGFGIVYNVTKLTAQNVTLAGTINAMATGAGGFAAGMAGVDAKFTQITLSGDFTADNGLGGIAQTAGGRIDINGLTVTGDASFDINTGSAIIYSGLIFGNSANAWVDVSNLQINDPYVELDGGSVNKYADLSGYTLYSNGTTYKNGSVVMGGIMNLKGAGITGYDPISVNVVRNGATATEAGTGSDQNRYYFNFAPESIPGLGTAESPFVISTPGQLQTFSVFNYLPSSLSWMMLDYFPEVKAMWDNPEISVNDVARVMYIKTAIFAISGTIDLSGTTYYPAPIIGGDYIGQNNATIVFNADNAASSGLNSSVRDNHSGLFTSITPSNLLNDIEIANLTFKGHVSGTYYPGAIAAGWHLPNSSNVFGLPGVSTGRLNVHDITADGLTSLSTTVAPNSNGEKKYGSYTLGEALLFGWIAGGDHSFSNMQLKGMTGTSADTTDAMIGRVSGSSTLLQLSRVEFQTISQVTDKYFEYAGFISQFDDGMAIYSYNPGTDDEKYDYYYAVNTTADGLILPPSRGNVQINMNPPYGELDKGFGTAASPFVIYSAAQLFTLANAIQSSELLGDTEDGKNTSGRLVTVNGKTIPKLKAVDGENYTEAMLAADKQTRAEISTYLANAHYVLSEDIDFYDEQVSGYIGIGTLSKPFAGVFNGHGHKITLSTGSIVKNGTTDNNGSDFGLFSYISGAEISNVVITSVSEGNGNLNNIYVQPVAAANSYNGMVAAVALGGDNILDNIYISGIISVVANPQIASTKEVYVGGYIGHIEAGTVIIKNLPENFSKNFSIYEGTTPVSETNKHYAVICPSIKDGYVLYEGNDSSSGVFLPSKPTADVTVNENISWQLGPVHGGGTLGTTYTLLTEPEAGEPDENLPYLPSDLGLTLNPSSGTLVGRPKYSGTFEFAVRVESIVSVDPNVYGSSTKTVYDTRIYTITVARAEYPTLIPETDISNLSYAQERVNLEFTNFPQPLESYYVNSLAELEYSCTPGNGVVEILTDASGEQYIHVLAVGETTITVIKPQDISYNEARLELTIKVVPATLKFIVDDKDTWWYGYEYNPNTDIKIMVQGLRGTDLDTAYDLEDSITFNGVQMTVAQALDSLGISGLGYDTPSALQGFSYQSPPATGDYRITIKEIVPKKDADGAEDPAFAEAMLNYNVEYYHGIVRIRRKVINAADYKVYLYGEGNSKTEITDKSDRLWFNNSFEVVPNPVTQTGEAYDLIREVTSESMGLNEGWVNIKTFLNETSQHTVKIQLKSSTNNYITESLAFSVLIDKTAPTAAVNFTTTHNDEPKFYASGSNFPKDIYGGVYKHAFNMTLTGNDLGNVMSGIDKMEYLFFDPFAEGVDASIRNLNWAAWTAPTNDPAQHRANQADLAAALQDLVDNHGAVWTAANPNVPIEIKNRRGFIYVRAVDKVKNYSDIVCYDYSEAGARDGWFITDEEGPSIEMLNDAGDYGTWRAYDKNGIPALRFRVGDSLSGVSTGTIKCTVNDTAATATLVAGSTGEYKVELKNYIKSNGTYTVKLTADDRIGNHSESFEFKVLKDSNVPSISFSHIADDHSTPEDWTDDVYTQSKSFSAGLTGTAPSGILSMVLYKINVVNGEEVVDLENPIAWTSVENLAYKYTATAEGKYRAVITKNSKDDDGNNLTAYRDIEVRKIDNTKIYFNVLRFDGTQWYNPADIMPWIGSNVQYSIAIQNPAEIKGQARLFLTMKDAEGNDIHLLKDPANNTVNGYPFTYDPATQSLSVDLSAIVNSVTQISMGNSVNSDFKFWIVSEADVYSDTDQNQNRIPEMRIKVDLRNPETITTAEIGEKNAFERGFLEAVTGGTFFKIARIVVTVNDADSGVRGVILTLTDQNGNPVTGKDPIRADVEESQRGTPSATVTVDIDTEHRGNIILIATDIVGNNSQSFIFTSTDVQPLPFWIDNTAPSYTLIPELEDVNGVIDGGYFTTAENGEIIVDPENSIWLYQGIGVTLGDIIDLDKNGEESDVSTGAYMIAWWSSPSEWVGDELPFNVAGITVNQLSVSELTPDENGRLTQYFDFKGIADGGDQKLPNGDYYLNFTVYDRSGNGKVTSIHIRRDSKQAEITDLDLRDQDMIFANPKTPADELDDAYDYFIHADKFAARGDFFNITVDMLDRVSPQFVEVQYRTKTAENTWGDWSAPVSVPVISDLSALPEGAELPATVEVGHAYYKIVSATEEDTEYRFTAYAGNGNRHTDSETVTLFVAGEQIDPEGFHPINIEDTTESAYADWVQSVATELKVWFKTSLGAPERLQYAVVFRPDGGEPQFVDAEKTGDVPFENRKKYSYTISYSVIKDKDGVLSEGIYDVYFRIVNDAGQISEYKTLTVRYDQTAPSEFEYEFVPGPYTADDGRQKDTYTQPLYGSNSKIYLTASDASVASGAALVYSYSTSSESGPWKAALYDEVAEKYYAPALEGSATSFNGTYYFKVTDAAGNESAVNTGSVTVDIEEPLLPNDITAKRADGSTDIGTNYYASDVIFTFPSGFNADVDHYM